MACRQNRRSSPGTASARSAEHRGRRRLGVAHVPDIVFNVVVRREQTARFRPAHIADDVDAAARRALKARRLVLAVGRHEAAIDQDDAAASQPRRREHPEALPFDIGAQRRTGSVGIGLLALEEFGGECDAGIFVGVRHQPLPAGARRQGFRRARGARRHGQDQIFFPDRAVELPDAEADQYRHADDGEDRRIEHAAAALRARHQASPFGTSPLTMRRPGAAL